MASSRVNKQCDSTVVVWEWLDKLRRWKAYSPIISSYIEKNYVTMRILDIGSIDPTCALYSVDVKMMEQKDPSGRKTSIRRAVYPPTTAPSVGIVWQWEDEHLIWHEFDMASNNQLEEGFSRKCQNVDLSKQMSGLPYLIDVKNMKQTNINSGFIRKVRRKFLADSYPVENSTLGQRPRATRSKLKKMKGNSSKPPYFDKNYMNNVSASSSSNPQQSKRPQKKSKPFKEIVTRGMSSSSAPNTMINTSGSHPNLSSGVSFPSTSSSDNSGISTSMAGTANSLLMQLMPLLSRASRSRLTCQNMSGESNDLFIKCAEQVRPGAKSYSLIKEKYTNTVAEIPNEVCCICQDDLHASGGFVGEGAIDCVSKLNRCGHTLHQSCLEAMYESGNKDGSVQCPTCKMIYGKKYGNCPTGRMEYRIMSSLNLPSFNCPTICIRYSITPGIQGTENSNPGRSYSCSGFPRIGYLPDNELGRKALKLLTIAWQRRLTFTVGTSTTTGRQDTVTWNEIHHKTDCIGNQSSHGYPDPNFFDNLFAELAAQGVTEEDDFDQGIN